MAPFDTTPIDPSGAVARRRSGSPATGDAVRRARRHPAVRAVPDPPAAPGSPRTAAAAAAGLGRVRASAAAGLGSVPASAGLGSVRASAVELGSVPAAAAVPEIGAPDREVPGSGVPAPDARAARGRDATLAARSGPTREGRSRGARRDSAAWRALGGLGAPVQRLFALLRCLPGAGHRVGALAAALAASEPETLTMLDTLAAAGLAASTTRGDVTVFTVSYLGAAVRPEWAGPEPRAVHRWYDWCLAHATAVADRLYPQALRLESVPMTLIPEVSLPTAGTASAWIEAEAPNLHAAILAARTFGLGSYAWYLADALRGWAWQHPTASDWVSAAAAAVSAARPAGDPRASASAYLSLADAQFLAGDLDAAEDACAAASIHASRAGWLSAAAAGHGNRGGIHHRRGRLPSALNEYRQALELFAAAGRPANQAAVCNQIGEIRVALGEPGEALGHHRRALVLFRQLGSLSGEARTLELLARAWHLLGQREAAERAIVQAYMVYGRLGDRAGAARARDGAKLLTGTDRLAS